MRVTPDDAGSQEARAGVERRRSFAPGKRRGGTPTDERAALQRAPGPSVGEWQHSFAWLGHLLRLSALRLLSFLVFLAVN